MCEYGSLGGVSLDVDVLGLDIVGELEEAEEEVAGN